MQRSGPHATDGDWRRYWRVLLAVLGAEMLVVSLLIVVGNPYGNLPHVAFSSHVIMDINQRYQYPAIVRSGRYDLIVIGTSTSRLLRPAALEALFGGKFANLAMNAATPWEQYRLTRLFLRHTQDAGTLLLGLDMAWCSEHADTEKSTKRGFPEWMYDENPLNDVLWMFNKMSAEIAGRRIATALGLNRERIPFDGYEVFTPPEAKYDLQKVRRELYGLDGTPPVARANVASPYEPSAEERAAWRYPAVAWLEELVSPQAKWQQVVLVFPPPHASTLPPPGSIDEARETECKARVARLAQRRGIAVVDFRIPSSITNDDRNYWDHLHYRVPIAERIVVDIARAVAEGRDDPGHDWRMLATGPRVLPPQATAAIPASAGRVQ